MAGFDHGPNETGTAECPDTARRNSRYGLILFSIYLALYGGFVLLNAFAPERMDRIIGGGINLAVAYGFGLIVAAFVLALGYGWLCRPAKDAAGTAAETERRS